MTQALHLIGYSLLAVVVFLGALMLATYCAFVVVDVLYEDRL